MGTRASRGATTDAGERCARELIGIHVETTLGNLRPALSVTSYCVSIEAYLTGQLDRLIEGSGLSGNRLGSKLLTTYRMDFTRTWRSRLSWIESALGLQLAGDTQAQSMELLNELRNAVVHGNLHLTDMQVADLGKQIALKRRLSETLDVCCVGRRVVIGERTDQKAFEVSVDFLIQVDRAMVTAR